MYTIQGLGEANQGLWQKRAFAESWDMTCLTVYQIRCLYYINANSSYRCIWQAFQNSTLATRLSLKDITQGGGGHGHVHRACDLGKLMNPAEMYLKWERPLAYAPNDWLIYWFLSELTCYYSSLYYFLHKLFIPIGFLSYLKWTLIPQFKLSSKMFTVKICPCKNVTFLSNYILH